MHLNQIDEDIIGTEDDEIEMDYNDPHVKTFILYQMHILHMEMPIVDYETDLLSILDQTSRLIIVKPNK